MDVGLRYNTFKYSGRFKKSPDVIKLKFYYAIIDDLVSAGQLELFGLMDSIWCKTTVAVKSKSSRGMTDVGLDPAAMHILDHGEHATNEFEMLPKSVPVHNDIIELSCPFS